MTRHKQNKQIQSPAITRATPFPSSKKINMDMAIH